MTPFEPTPREVLDFCAQEPIERVFLEELARQRLGRFAALGRRSGLTALCHLGANIVPSGIGCDEFAGVVAGDDARMLIGDERAVSELWHAACAQLPPPREDRPGQPVYAITAAPPGGESGLRPAAARDFDLLLPACAAAHAEELGVDPLLEDGEAFRRRVRRQIDVGRSWLWEQDGMILFKAEASAWTPHAVQIAQVWVDPPLRNRGFARRGLRDLCRLLLGRVPAVCLFVRRENAAAMRVYEAVGMRRVSTCRSILFA